MGRARQSHEHSQDHPTRHSSHRSSGQCGVGPCHVFGIVFVNESRAGGPRARREKTKREHHKSLNSTLRVLRARAPNRNLKPHTPSHRHREQTPEGPKALTNLTSRPRHTQALTTHTPSHAHRARNNGETPREARMPGPKARKQIVERSNRIPNPTSRPAINRGPSLGRPPPHAARPRVRREFVGQNWKQ